MADKETEAKWEKSKRIEAEKMKAARSLAYHEEDKVNQAFLDPAKVRGFSRDPNVVARSAERLANVSIVSTLLGILFGIFLQLPLHQKSSSSGNRDTCQATLDSLCHTLCKRRSPLFPSFLNSFFKIDFFLYIL